MTTENKIQCECGHVKLLSKSNISAHRKRTVHIKNMAALNDNSEKPLENTIICQTVTQKTKVVKEKKQAAEVKEPKQKNVKKSKVPNGFVREINKKIKPSRKFILSITKITIVKLNHIENFKHQIIKQVNNDDKLKELQNVIDVCVNTIDLLKEEISNMNKVVVLPVNDNPIDDSFECWQTYDNCPMICSFKWMQNMKETIEMISHKKMINEIVGDIIDDVFEKITNSIKIEIQDEIPCEPINEIIRNNNQEKSNTLSEYLKTNYGFSFDGFVTRIAVQVQYMNVFVYVYKGGYKKGDKPYKTLKQVSAEPCRLLSCILEYVFTNMEHKNLIVVDFTVDKKIQDDLEKLWYETQITMDSKKEVIPHVTHIEKQRN
jgi:hypothetical protein